MKCSVHYFTESVSLISFDILDCLSVIYCSRHSMSKHFMKGLGFTLLDCFLCTLFFCINWFSLNGWYFVCSLKVTYSYWGSLVFFYWSNLIDFCWYFWSKNCCMIYCCFCPGMSFYMIFYCHCFFVGIDVYDFLKWDSFILLFVFCKSFFWSGVRS